MATLTFYQPTNMDTSIVWYGDLTVASSNQIQISSGSRVQNYYGNFTYSYYGGYYVLSGGTLTSTNQYQDGMAIYNVTGLNHDFLTIYNYLQSGDITSAYTYSLNGNDSMHGSYGSDVISSYGGDDVLSGYGGNDILNGGSGNDTLYGGSGNNTLTGGSGIDTFGLTLGAQDTVTDFVPGEGGDVLQVSDIVSALTHYVGGQANPFATGHFKVVQDGNDTLFQVDADGFGATYAFETAALLCDVNASSLRSANFSSGFNPQVSPGFNFDILFTGDLIQAMYVAYYGRPAEQGGFDYWTNRLTSEGRNFSGMSAAFATSDEFNARYGGLDTAGLVTTAYQQLFGRDPDSGGLAWYVNLINSGQTNYVQLVLDMMGGAQGNDLLCIYNRLSASNDFTQTTIANPGLYEGHEAAAQAADLLQLVLGSQDTLNTYQTYKAELLTEWARGTGNGASYQTSESINYIGDNDAFGVLLTAGHTYQFLVAAVQDSGLDPMISHIRNPQGHLLENGLGVPLSDADSGPGNAAQLSITPTVTGEFFVEIVGQANTTGAYQLSVVEL